MSWFRGPGHCRAFGGIRVRLHPEAWSRSGGSGLPCAGGCAPAAVRPAGQVVPGTTWVGGARQGGGSAAGGDRALLEDPRRNPAAVDLGATLSLSSHSARPPSAARKENSAAPTPGVAAFRRATALVRTTPIRVSLPSAYMAGGIAHTARFRQPGAAAITFMNTDAPGRRGVQQPRPDRPAAAHGQGDAQAGEHQRRHVRDRRFQQGRDKQMPGRVDQPVLRGVAHDRGRGRQDAQARGRDRQPELRTVGAGAVGLGPGRRGGGPVYSG